MATVKVKFRPSTVNGKAGVLYYRLCHGQSNKQIITHMRIFPHWWNEEKGELVPTQDNGNVLFQYKRQIEKDLQTIRRIIRELDEKGKKYTVSDIISIFHTPVTQTTILSYLGKHIKTLKKDEKLGTARNFQRTQNSFSTFLKGEDIPFSQLDEVLIIEYEKWLLDRNLSRNSSSFYMRNLRSAYNKAVAEHLAEQTHPFQNVYTGIDHTRKRAVGEDVIIRLQTLNLDSSLPLAFTRDLFLFSYCTRGMAFIDIAFLKKENIQKGMLSYIRHKTGRRLNIRIEPCTADIIKRYETADKECPYVFPIITSTLMEKAYQEYQTALGYHNRKLKHLGQLIGENLSLSSYTPRHSWASAARNHDVPLYVISAGMGHASEKTTLIYLNSVENSVIDQANKGILATLNDNISK